QDLPCPQPPLLLNLMPNDLRPLHSPPPVLPRQLDLPRHPRLEAHIQKHSLPHSTLFLPALGEENLPVYPLYSSPPASAARNLAPCQRHSTDFPAPSPAPRIARARFPVPHQIPPMAPSVRHPPPTP